MKNKQKISRKQLRKAKKAEKKQRIQKHQLAKQHRSMKKVALLNKNSAHSRPTHSQNISPKTNIYIQPEGDPQFVEEEESCMQSSPSVMNEEEEQLQLDKHSDDERIEMLEQKLNIKGCKSKKYDKIAQSLGFDDDLFNFLDGISAKVNQGKKKKQTAAEQKQQIAIESAVVKSKKKGKKQILKNQKVQTQKQQPQMPSQKAEGNKFIPWKGKNAQNAQGAEIKKRMNSLFNKISDGNILYTVRAFVQIFQTNPKSLTMPTFSLLFMRFNLMIEKPLTHVLTANVIVAVAMHRIYGNRVMAQIVYDLTKGFQDLNNEMEDQNEVEEIGYSRIFEKKKNYFSLLCYLYEFQSISAEFLQSLVGELAKDLGSRDNVQFIYIIIQKCGAKMRANDTGALKQTIDVLRGGIQNAKKDGTYQTTKIKFIDIEINEIRFNRKTLFDSDQRMGFLHTFLNKTLPAQMPIEQCTLDASYSTVKAADPNIHQWWLQGSGSQDIHPEEDLHHQLMGSDNEQMKTLRQLAKAYHFVTEVRKNIFFELMSSQDYIQATKKIMEMKVKRLQQISIVLLEVNIQESQKFNPFYALVASKIAEQIPKFRVSLQFSIWDRLKQLQELSARKLSNLSKFTAWLISSQTANCSLSIFKFFPDLTNLRPRQTVFMKAFFRQFFRKVKKQYLIKLSQKLKEDRNKNIRDGIKQFLGQMKADLGGQIPKIKQNLNLLRKMLLVQEFNQMGDDQ